MGNCHSMRALVALLMLVLARADISSGNLRMLMRKWKGSAYYNSGADFIPIGMTLGDEVPDASSQIVFATFGSLCPKIFLPHQRVLLVHS